MDLYLIRHAHAVDGGLGLDADRPLSAEGRRAALAVGAALAEAGVVLDEIVASPYVRAVETAELLAVSLRHPGQLAISRGLVPEARPSRIIDEVVTPRRGAGEDARVALVGHEPAVGALLSFMLGRPGLTFGKGVVARVTWDGARGKLVWALGPGRLSPGASLDAGG